MYFIELLKYLLWPIILVLAYYLSLWAIHVMERNTDGKTAS